MIYASLKPIPQWASRFTVPGYLIYGAMSGAVLLNALLHVWQTPLPVGAWLALVATALGWMWKLATWQHNDALQLPATAASATGLGQVEACARWNGRTRKRITC